MQIKIFNNLCKFKNSVTGINNFNFVCKMNRRSKRLQFIDMRRKVINHLNEPQHIVDAWIEEVWKWECKSESERDDFRPIIERIGMYMQYRPNLMLEIMRHSDYCNKVKQ